MTTIKLSLATFLFSSTFAIAGGDIAPIQPYVETPAIEASPTLSGFYAGLAYSCLHLTQDTPDETTTAWSGASVSVGYDYNQYLAIEGRYTTSINDVKYEAWNIDEDKSWDMSNVAIYLKPQYSFGIIGAYGLIGYGQTKFDNGTSYTENGLQYGAGLTATINENVQLFVDYRRLYDDVDFDGYAIDKDVAENSWSIGINYKF